MKRCKMKDRGLPRYSQYEELTNGITHALGIIFGGICLAMCLTKSASTLGLISSLIYCISMIAVYTVSTVYHSLPTGRGKKGLQVLDNCTSYTLIAGTYTPIMMCAFLPNEPAIGWGILAFQWISTVMCIVLNAIDLRRFRIVSMVFYILMGCIIIFFTPLALRLLTPGGFYYVLAGGISYTIGAILYGIGSKLPWFHSVFHVFVLLGSILQFWGIYHYILF